MAATPSSEWNKRERQGDQLVDELEALIGPALFHEEPKKSPKEEASAGQEAFPLEFSQRFTIREVLGQGSMGRVFDAWDERLRRRVAIKVLNRRSPFAAELMRREREVLAALQHPNIVAVYDCGELADGQPYFVMQHVDGEDLRSFIRSRRLSRKEMLRLVTEVARAVGVAHLVHIIHRDLKPKNIIVSQQGKPMVLDFGLAKFIPADDVASSITTTDVDRTVALGKIKGTLAYMSPEQARALPVDSRTDVYSLGVILHELITGSVPVDPTGTDIQIHQWGDYLLSRPRRPCGEQTPAIPRDLAAIVDRCLECDPKDRYANAMELADDLDAYLQGRPVAALKKRRWLYVADKFTRAHARSLLGIAVLFFLVVGVIAQAFVRVSRARNVAIAERQRAEDREAIARPFLYASQIRQAQLHWQNREVDEARRLLDQQIPGPGQLDLRGFDWHYLRELVSRVPHVLAAHLAPVVAIDLATDVQEGKTILASGDATGTILLWDVDSQSPELKLLGHQGPVTALAFSRTMPCLVSAGDDGTIRVWSLADGSPLREMKGHEAPITALGLSPDGRRVASSDKEGWVRLWDFNTGQSEAPFRAHGERGTWSLDWSPDGMLLAAGGKDQTAAVWNVATREKLATLGPHAGPVRVVRFTPDGLFLATAGWDRSLRYWNTRDGFSLAYDGQWGAEAPFINIIFGRTGQEAWLGLANGLVSVSLPPPQYVAKRTFRLERDEMRAMALHEKSGKAASVYGGTEIHLWDRSDTEEYHTIEDRDTFDRMVLLPGRNEVATSDSRARRITVWEFTTDKKKLVLEGHSSPITSIAPLPNGRWLMSTDADGVVCLWNLDQGKLERTVIKTGSPVVSIAVSPDGRHFVLGGIGTVTLRKVDTGEIVWQRNGHGSMMVSDVAFTPDGHNLASGGWDNSVKVWETVKGGLVKGLPGTNEAIFRLAISPNGRYLAATSRKGAVTVWNLQAGERETSLVHPQGASHGIAFSPDSRFVAVGTNDSANQKLAPIHFWNLETRIETMTLNPATRWVTDIVFSADGRTLLAAGHGLPGCAPGNLFLFQGVTDSSGRPTKAPEISTGAE
ncbi:MAG: protein kinase [Planctomycetota bacterium]